MSNGELDLHRLLATLHPKLRDGEFVFVTFPKADEKLQSAIGACMRDAVGTFMEEEGFTMIVPADCGALPADIPRSGPQRMVTLECHSSLEAVGLTYRVSERLASLSISCNVVAAYYHDHLFISADKAAAAVHALRALQAEAEAEAQRACAG